MLRRDPVFFREAIDRVIHMFIQYMPGLTSTNNIHSKGCLLQLVKIGDLSNAYVSIRIIAMVQSADGPSALPSELAEQRYSNPLAVR